MTLSAYTISLSPDEERLAQLLTRDAWLFFSNLITHREIFHVKEIPMMPRRGVFEIANDAELIQYYLEAAFNYTEELAVSGWDAERATHAAEALIATIERETGLRRGAELHQEKIA